MSWNPAQYLKFAAPRLRPALDLLARVDVDAPARVVDLGCGTGEATRLLAARWPQARVQGVDASPAMLERARAGADGAAVEWVHADLRDWASAEPVQLVFSNAALHWLGDHEALFAHLLRQLAPGGVLAVQMPSNFDAPSHTTIADTVDAGAWRDRLAPLLRPAPVHDAPWYYGRLAPACERVDVWQTEYLHVLEGADPVKEWVKGTWLAPLLAALADDDERAAFEADYAARLRPAYPRRADGSTLFGFRRLFIVARRR